MWLNGWEEEDDEQSKQLMGGSDTLLLWDFLEVKPQRSRHENTFAPVMLAGDATFAQSLNKNLKGWIPGQSRKD